MVEAFPTQSTIKVKIQKTQNKALKFDIIGKIIKQIEQLTGQGDDLEISLDDSHFIALSELQEHEQQGLEKIKSKKGKWLETKGFLDLLPWIKHTRKKKIFISYAHEDQRHLNELEKHLAWAEAHAAYWSDRKLNPGERWDARIESELRSSDVILLLVTPNIGQSNYIKTKEMHIAMEMAQNNQALFIPIVLEDCPWEFSELKDIQLLIPSKNPDQSINWADIVRKLVETVDQFKKDETPLFH
ncbi:MAG: toll/interleukin-1 receptor domain-containing protein [Lewinellaceae bacterium]|nr:toll/interleukin-1 receptor domain-containing protein [Lewinellaceae bacterium]